MSNKKVSDCGGMKPPKLIKPKPIKFRGRTKDETWVKGQYCKMVQDCYVVRHTIITSFTIDELDWYHPMIDYDEVDEKTIGQFTGLKDKNGIEIYEGDIITTDLERNYLIVEYRNGAFMLNCNDGEEDYYDIFFSTYEEPKEVYKYGEVIGNIYDNPELMEVEK